MTLTLAAWTLAGLALPHSAPPAAMLPTGGAAERRLRERSSGEIHAVVFAPVAEGAPWQPFGRYKRRGAYVRFTRLDGLLVSCKTTPANPPAPQPSSPNSASSVT